MGTAPVFSVFVLGKLLFISHWGLQNICQTKKSFPSPYWRVAEWLWRLNWSPQNGAQGLRPDEWEMGFIKTLKGFQHFSLWRGSPITRCSTTRVLQFLHWCTIFTIFDIRYLLVFSHFKNPLVGHFYCKWVLKYGLLEKIFKITCDRRFLQQL